MGFLEKLPKEFISSAVRQVGRDGGKVISNKIYKGQHGTPIYNSGDNSNSSQGNQITDLSNIDMSIQPPIKGGGIGVILKGVLIQIIPFGLIPVLIKGISYLRAKTTNVYAKVPNRIQDRRYKEGYRIEGYSIVKTPNERILKDFEIKKLKNRGICYLSSIGVFFLIASILYFNSEKTSSNNTETTHKLTNTYWYIGTDKGVNVRKEPSMQGEVLFKLTSTDSVLIIDKNGPLENISGKSMNWFKVAHNSEEGWIWSGLLKENK
jgi:hypothetical protein